jgi:preprotein translocase subunit SecE
MAHRSGSVKRSRFGFFADTIAELKKVVWLTRREVIYLTFLVLAITVAVALILGATDLGFTRLVSDFFMGK